MFPFPDKVGARDEIGRDILCRKIPADHVAAISDRAWETGVQAAESVIAEYGAQAGIREIIRREGLAVERVARDNVAGNVRCFSEYYSGQNRMYLYTESIRMWAASNQMPDAEAEELILAHEFFHYLECRKIGLTSRQYKVPTLKIGRFVLMDSGIRALSEIGAHGFARTFHERRSIDGGQATNHEASRENAASKENA